MNVVITFFSGEHYGWGHEVRCLELADRLVEKGHNVTLATNLQYRRKHPFFQIRLGFPDDFYFVMEQAKPDWVVFDFPNIPSKYFFGLARTADANTMFLNACGDEKEKVADICVVQGILDDKQFQPGPLYLHGIDYVLLRQVLKDVELNPKWWFVFGGAVDQMKLLTKFADYMPDEKAVLVRTPSVRTDLQMTDKHIVLDAMQQDVTMSFGTAERACISFGMTAWDFAYLGIPVYAFARTGKHLAFAEGMQNAGLIRVFPKIGIPREELFRDFLSEPFKPSGQRPDLLGVDRLIQFMEE